MQSESATLSRLRQARTLEQLFAVICSHGEATALVYEDRGVAKSLTYSALERRVKQAASRLRTLVGADHVGRFVALHLDNCMEWPILFWGLLMAGYRPLLLDARASAELSSDLVARARAVAVVTDRADAVARGERQLPVADVLVEDTAPEPEARWEDLVALCTSGTTGTAKLVVFEGAAIASNVCHAVSDMRGSPYLMRPVTRNLAFAPFFHVMGLMTLALYTAAGKTTVIPPDRLPATLKRICLRDGVNILYAVPLMWNAMANKIRTGVGHKPVLARAVFKILCGISRLAQAISPHRGQRFVQQKLFGSFHRNALGGDICLVSGAAPLPRRTARMLTTMGFPLLSGYGMTEAGVISIDLGSSLGPRLGGSVGRPIGPTEVRVSGGGEAGQVGELEVRGESLYKYELRDGALVPAERRDGWMATGDVGRIADGHIHILSRSKDIITPASGEKVYPEEVEEAMAALPGIESSSVVGLSDERGGEAVCLVLYPGARSVDASEAMALAGQVHHRNEGLALPKRVIRILLSEAALPATTTMKIKRQLLKRALEAGEWSCRELSLSGARSEPHPSPSPGPVGRPAPAERGGPPAGELEARLRTVVAEVLQVPPATLRDDAHFLYDLGADSLKLLELLVRVEQAFEVIDERQTLRACASVRELASAIVELRAGLLRARATRPAGTVQPVKRLEEDPRFLEMSQRLASYGATSPYFVPHDSAIRDTSMVEGTELVNFTSYNYLGLSGHPEVVAAAQRAAAELGTSASGSRLLTGEKSLYRQLERELAEWKHAEDALVLVSGHATNVSFVGNFCGEADLILYDALSHDSVVQGCQLSRSESRAFPHNDVSALRRLLEAVRPRYERVLIIVEGVYSMDGDVAPIRELVALKRQHGAFLMVDEAHSAGVLGQTGGGIDEHFGLEAGDVDIRMGTLSKTLGSCGGYLAGPAKLIDYLRYALPGFVFSVGISPPNAAAALAALRTLRAEPQRVERLHANIRCFLREAGRLGLDTCGAGESAITPILVGDERRAFALSARMRERGIFVAPAIHPAVPRGQARLRFCVTSEHRADQITRALDTLSLMMASDADPASGPAIAAARAHAGLELIDAAPRQLGDDGSAVA